MSGAGSGRPRAGLRAAPDAEALIEANLGGVQKVLGAALDAGVKRIVHVSTLSALFHVDANARAKPITPDTEPHESEHAYGRSKAMAERWVRERQAEGAPIWTTYPSAVLAPDDPGMTESTNALRIFAGQFVRVSLFSGFDRFLGFLFGLLRGAGLGVVELLEV